MDHLDSEYPQVRRKRPLDARRATSQQEDLEGLLADHVASKDLIARPIVRIYVLVALCFGVASHLAFTALRRHGAFERLGFARHGVLGSDRPNACMSQDYVDEELKKLVTGATVRG